MNEKLLDAKTVAEYIGVHVKTVHVMVKDGRLKGYRLGVGYRFFEEDVMDYIKGRDGKTA